MHAYFNMYFFNLQLKLYAMEQKVNARISDAYSAKGENSISLQMLHDNGQNGRVFWGKIVTPYTLFIHIVFPLVSILFLGWLFHHQIENDERNCFWYFKESNLNLHFSADMSDTYILTIISIVSSLSFVVYVLILDVLAIRFWITNVKEEIFFPNVKNKTTIDFQIEHSIPIVLCTYDVIIFIFMLVFLICTVRRVSCCQNNWYYFYLGPCSCIIVHAYHILIGFIHAPRHASAILIFYAIVGLVFFVTYRAAYYNLVKFYKKYKSRSAAKSQKTTTDAGKGNEGASPLDSDGSVNSADKSKNSEEEVNPEELPFPCCCLCSTHMQKKCSHPLWIFSMFAVLSLIIAAVIVFIVILFILVPINSAIDDAPERIFSINQTIIVLIGVSVTYNLYKTRSTENSFFEKLVKANLNRLKETEKDNDKLNNLDKWQAMGRADQEKEMAGLLIDTLLKIKN